MLIYYYWLIVGLLLFTEKVKKDFVSLTGIQELVKRLQTTLSDEEVCNSMRCFMKRVTQVIARKKKQ